MSANDQKPDPRPVDGGKDGKADKPYVAVGGEDEGSTEHDGDDSHLHDDQKSDRLST